MGQTAFCTSLAGEEIGRIRTWGTHPRRLADYTEASPTLPCDLPQTLFEPILLSTAACRGARVRFDTVYESLERVSEHLGVPIEPFVIGPGHELEDLYGDWARVREIPDQGCLLVRQDAHIAYRASGLPEDATEALQQAFSKLLGR